MKTDKSLKSRVRGSALVVVLFAVVILLLTGGGLLSLGLQGRLQAIRSSTEIAARCAADAGLTKALFEMNEKLKLASWDNSALPEVLNETLLNCDATFNYKVTGDLSSGYTVESIGKSGHAQKRVVATLRLKGLFDSGILAKQTIQLYNGAIVDAYDSSNPGTTDVPVQVATTSSDAGSISLKSGSSVDGEVLVGVDAYFPIITPPLLPDMGTAIEVQNETLAIGTADSGKYTGVILKTGAILVVDDAGAQPGEVVLYVTGDVLMGQGCELVIKPGTSLTLYLDGDFIANNSCGVNNESEDSTAFTLYGTGVDQTLELKAKTDWYGAVYAPNADVIIKSGAEVYGSFVCASFEAKEGGLIIYDAALRDVNVNDIGAFFVVDRWQE
ncbi:MAG TPA: collagen-binding domain-containing protein [Sedimentisphaerales bacterium]|nr:collagen-binding domain-containing protein [Sedimentisphaerales bacterium]